jgi:hypothetical protein
MLMFSGLGFATELAPQGGVPNTFTVASVERSAIEATAAGMTAPMTGGCAPGDVLSEMGCLTPMVPMPGSTSMNTIWGCPAGSQPYNSQYCLRTNDVAAEQAAAAAAAALAAAQAQAAAQAAAEAQAAADAAAAAAAVQQASQAAQDAANAEALRQQQYADAVAAAAAQAAQQAIDAYVAAHGGSSQGTEPSPGMTLTPTAPPQSMPVARESAGRPSHKWLMIGAGVVGVGLLAALIARR